MVNPLVRRTLPLYSLTATQGGEGYNAFRTSLNSSLAVSSGIAGCGAAIGEVARSDGGVDI